MYSTVYLAAEDVPGLAIGRKLIAEQPPLTVYREENARGFGTLKTKTPNFDQMSKNGFPVLMLTDLDLETCPHVKIDAWLGRTASPGFLFRICADRDATSQSSAKVCDSPGSELLIRAIDRDDPRPLWVTVWGGPNVLGQALREIPRHPLVGRDGPDMRETIPWS